MSTSDRVIVVPDLAWGFDERPPTVSLPGESTREQVDPCPGYGHDPKLVAETLELCEKLFPVEPQPRVYLLKHEFIGRTNGHTGTNYDYAKKDENGQYPRHSYISLSGKRIPPHPAMTRYLVTHEYGHAVDNYLAALRYPKEGTNADGKQDEEYRELRGLTTPPFYGPGTWHQQVSEVFANDFRLFVTGVEPEFWPHEVPPPREVPKVADWWMARLWEVSERRKQLPKDVKIAS